MKAVKYRWNPNKMIWWAYKNDETLAVAKEICGEGPVVSVAPAAVPAQPARTVKKYVRKSPSKDYALKVAIKDIIAADKAQLDAWEKILKDHVNYVCIWFCISSNIIIDAVKKIKFEYYFLWVENYSK